MQRLYIKTTAFFLIIVVLYFFFTYDFEVHDKHSVTVTKEQQLLHQIKKEASKYEEAPEDAYIDRVWKKTPGREGRKVNLKESYEKMKEQGVYDTDLIVYDTVAPEIHLDDLPASPIYRGHPDKNMVSLLINVSWGEEHIPSMLQTLKDHQVKATFFIEGQWAANNKDEVKMIAEQEHIIGNHAFNHPDMAKMTDQQIKEQIEKTNDILKAITGETPTWFAPPSGSYNDQVVTIAHDMKMQTILWTVDTIDWQNPSVSVMMDRVMTNTHPGATILMHPTNTIVQGLDRLIDSLKEEEYKVGTIEQLLQESR